MLDHREAIRDWLWRERRLELNPKRQGVRPTSQPVTYLGYRVSRAGVLPGPKAKRRLKRNLRELKPKKLVRTLRSYRGLLLSL